MSNFGSIGLLWEKLNQNLESRNRYPDHCISHHFAVGIFVGNLNEACRSLRKIIATQRNPFAGGLALHTDVGFANGESVRSRAIIHDHKCGR